MGLDPALNDLTQRVIGAAIEVHRHLGPGFREVTYQKALECELRLCDIRFRAQCPVKLHYKGVEVGEGFVDLLVEDRLVVELKAVEHWDEIFEDQAVAYLKMAGLQLGLVINFNVGKLYAGVKRVINT